MSQRTKREEKTRTKVFILPEPVNQKIHNKDTHQRYTVKKYKKTKKAITF